MSQAKEPKSVKECPHTPARIPLADLISSTEDAMVQDPALELTPEDHVIWQHVPASSNPKSQPSATNRKKRRHSSSPTGSPSEHSKTARKEPFDLQSFQALLKTPQNDIAADLWNNYVEKHKANGNGNIQLPRFDNLLNSSPQTPASARISRDSSGLRRSISCNAEWPTSRTKRRKMDVQGDDSMMGRSPFSRTRSNVLDSGKSKPSRLNFLIDKIEKSLQKPSSGAPNSSPSRDRKTRTRSRSTSPVERRASEKFHHQLDGRSENPKGEHGHPSSSEFGDEDLDQDLLDFAAESMDTSIKPDHSPCDIKPAKSVNTTGLGLEQQHLNQQHASQHPAPGVRSGHATAAVTCQGDTSFDEFGDDSDGLPEGLEGMAAQYDQVPVSNDMGKTGNGHMAPEMASMAGTRAPKEVQQAEETFDDEFDDDGFDLEAIEQSMKQSGEDGSNNVCHS